MAMSERDAGLFEAPEPPEPRASLRAIELTIKLPPSVESSLRALSVCAYDVSRLARARAELAEHEYTDAKERARDSGSGAEERLERRAKLDVMGAATALLVSGRDAARAYARSVDAELRDKRQGWR